MLHDTLIARGMFGGLTGL